MASVVTLRIPASQFALDETFAVVSNLRLDSTRVATPSPETPLPFVVMTAPDFEGIDAALTDDPTVETHSLLAATDDERRYWIEWATPVTRLIDDLLVGEGAIIAARAEGDVWTLELLFPTREAIAESYDRCLENGLSPMIEEIYGVDGIPELQQAAVMETTDRGADDMPRSVQLN